MDHLARILFIEERYRASTEASKMRESYYYQVHENLSDKDFS
jgi:hypothetical protein